MVCPTYVSELSPKHIRGRITGLFQVIVVIGVAGKIISRNVKRRLISSFILDHLRCHFHRPSKRRYPMANPCRVPACPSRNHDLHYSIHEGKSTMASYQAQERARTQEPRLDPKDFRGRPRDSSRICRDRSFYRGGGGHRRWSIMEGGLCPRKQDSILYRFCRVYLPAVVRSEVSLLYPSIVSGDLVSLGKPFKVKYKILPPDKISSHPLPTSFISSYKLQDVADVPLAVSTTTLPTFLSRSVF